MIAEEARLEVVPRLDPEELRAVTWLVERATEADAVRPLSEHVELQLRHGSDPAARHVLLWATTTDTLAGYGHLDLSDPGAARAELAVDPGLRGQGYGAALLRGLLQESRGRLQVWAHGGLRPAEALARSSGLRRVRELWQMRRPLAGPLPEPVLPQGVRLRAFEPGRDDEAWLAVNREAFATHPEQGRWTSEDLRQRLLQPWFDPSGFLLAVEDGPRGEHLLGFHWTKVHGASDGGEALGGEVLGEVYVVGVSPAAQGSGLGRAVTLAGLHHLRAGGVPTAMLYVDADNAAAVRLYTGLGFRRHAVDVMYTSDRGSEDPAEGTTEVGR